MGYAKHVAVKNIPQKKKTDSKQIKNSASGYTFQVDCWSMLDRFLILGTEGGTYYIGEQKLTKNSAQSVQECYRLDADRTINRIVEVSDKGLAAKNEPAIFALALCARYDKIKKVLPKVCRTATHLFQFVDAVNTLGGWGRRIRNAVASWYLNQNPDDLAYQLCKYRNREGWTHCDVLRKCHAKTKDETINNLLRWAVGKNVENKHHYVKSFELAQSTVNKHDIIKLIKSKGLVRECIPNTWFNDKDIWEALLEKMPMTALIRNLPKLSEVGLLTPLSDAESEIVQKLKNQESLFKSRIHPFKVLLALKGYEIGKNRNLSWNISNSVLSALDDAYYSMFKNVEPTNKKYLLALDVSGSMTTPIMGSNISCRDASGALAMITLKTENKCHVMGFADKFIKLPLTSKDSLPSVIRKISNIPFGGTDCSLPMIYALENKIPVDVFIIYTDNETWAGKIHPHIALQEYRRKMNINSKLIVVGMTANKFSIADPNDKGMLDIVGFSSDIPDVIRNFVLQ